MVPEKEIIMLLVGMGTCLFLLFYRDAVNGIPYGRLLLTGFFLTFSGWFFTFAGNILAFQFARFFEFIGYTGGVICVTIWCFRTLPHRSHEDHAH
ncbi:MAG: hypothetical protein JW863_04865 [Chitinispirillaceae bacterium]|nr:hypothetical protein [Chitinispirillaceae bacterium]